MNELIDKKFIVENDNDKRYEFNSDFNSGEYVFIDKDILYKLMELSYNYSQYEGLIIQLYLELIKEYNVYTNLNPFVKKNGIKVSQRDLAEKIGYSRDNSVISRTVGEILDILKIEGFISWYMDFPDKYNGDNENYKIYHHITNIKQR